MEQKFIYFRSARVLVDANNINGVYVDDKGMARISLYDCDGEYDLVKTSISEIISAMEQRKIFVGLILEVN